MIDVKNLSKIKEINILHIEFDFRFGRFRIGDMYYNHYPVAYINERFLYYIVANKQPLKVIDMENVLDDFEVLDGEISNRLKNNFACYDFVVVGSKTDVSKKFKEIGKMIENKRTELAMNLEKDRNHKKYNECLEFISWYNKTYIN